jgi:DNA-3-methyladenine glycosylase
MSRLKPLPREFFAPSAEEVAPALLGHYLLRKTARGWCGGPIVETEAYLIKDPACHGAVGLTPRNRVMFGEPGHAYVYLIYGLHYCVNAVCQPAGVAEAVLIRAVEAELAVEQMMAWRAAARPHELTNGPAKLCEAMRIDRKLDSADLCRAGSELIIAANPGLEVFKKSRGPVVITTRVGITQAAALPLRFYLDSSSFISKRRRSAAELG